MPLTVEQLREEVLALPRDERRQLLASLAGDSSSHPLDLHPAWEEELRHRVREFEEGRMETVPWEVIRNELNGLEDVP